MDAHCNDSGPPVDIFSDPEEQQPQQQLQQQQHNHNNKPLRQTTKKNRNRNSKQAKERVTVGDSDFNEWENYSKKQQRKNSANQEQKISEPINAKENLFKKNWCEGLQSLDPAFTDEAHPLTLKLSLDDRFHDYGQSIVLNVWELRDTFDQLQTTIHRQYKEFVPVLFGHPLASLLILGVDAYKAQPMVLNKLQTNLSSLSTVAN